MASATLNSTLMETLVTRSVSSIDSHSAVAHSGSQEGFASPLSLSPSSGDPPPSFLPDNPFHASYSRFLTETDLKENSISGGEVTTEDEEASLGDGLAYYFKRLSDDSLSTSSKKRRKQVNPVRVSSSEDNSNNHTPQATLPSDETYPNKMQSSPHGEQELLKCPHCLRRMPSEDALRNHIIEEHIGRILSQENIRNTYQHMLTKQNDNRISEDRFSIQEREEGEMTPLNLSSQRWEQRPISHIRENGERSPESGVSIPSSLCIPSSYGDTKFGFPGLVPLGPPPFLLPFLHHQTPNQERDRLHPTQQPLRPVSNGQAQIFNLEAYCDLCNKEFCNKYFLKTHKANKHGIYSPDICSSLSIPNSNIVSPSLSSSTQAHQNISTPAVTTPLTVPALQNSPLSSVPLPGSPFAGAFITANMSALPIRPLIHPHFPSLQKNQMNFTKSDFLGSTSKNGIINIEAYCEICQKEFCNKYFLKRHKAKIHNIDIEVTIKNTSRSSLHPNNSCYDRPEGWCDACRKDIGSRTRLNTHKLNVHGPHIIVPMTSSHNPGDQPNSTPEFQSDHQKNLSPNIPSENFSPWDSKREERLSESQADVLDNQQNYDHNSNGKLRVSTSLMETDNDMRSENVRSKMEFWDNTDDQDMSTDQPWNEPFQNIKNVSELNLNKSSNDNVSRDSILVKEEPRNFSDEKIIENSTHQDNAERDKEMDNVTMSTINKHSNEQQKPVDEIPDYKCKEPGENICHNQPMSKELNESPRTPGAGSSTDENSRELGLVCRAGQPAIVQPASGTKYTADQLRQLGVINPDAFCELCCKEFCNKYFLRTHRIKKHGIYTPEYSDRSKNYKDHSPLSLAQILEKQALEMRAGLSEVEGDTKCDICRRSFPTIYLLQMHKYYIHGPGQEILHQEQLFQLQNHPIQAERLRQMSFNSDQQKLDLEINKAKAELPQLREIQQHSFHNKQLLLHQDELKHKDLVEPHIESFNNSTNTHFNDGVKINTGHRREIQEEMFRNQDAEVTLRISQPSRISPPNSQADEFKLNPQEPDTSQGLRKLQTMLLELNRQDEVMTKCRICQKDVGNEYILRAHLMTDHGILPQNELTIQNEVQTPRTSRDGTPVSSPTSTLGLENQGFCNICKRDFFSRYILQQHLLSSHGIFTPTKNPVSFLDRIRAEIENREDRRPISISRSYCEICNKELCNKYFMKTHMLKMHGINIENGTSGGVTCDICRKELCSKYFLRVHKQNTHGLVDETLDNEVLSDEGELQICPLCSKRFKNLKWLQTHLNSDHDDEGKEKWKEIESSIPNWESSIANYQLCSICGQNFPDLVTLQIHVIRNHGAKFSDKEPGETTFVNQEEEDYRRSLECSICHINFPNHTLLYAHEKTHSSNIPQVTPPPVHSQRLQCPLCSQTIASLELYHQHILHHQLEGFLKPLFSEESSPQPNLKVVEKTPEATEGESPNNEVKNRTPSTPKKRWRCYECGTKFKSRNHCMMHVQTRHISKVRWFNIGRSPCRRKLYRCRKCGGFAKSLSTLKKHLRKKHPSISEIPTSHAQPSVSGEQFVMQPFLLNKEGCDGPTSTFDEEQPFVPSLVYLPVAKKVQRPLTVSFCLTPA